MAYHALTERRTLAELLYFFIEILGPEKNYYALAIIYGPGISLLATLREEAAANARIRHYAALRELRIARADHDAATVDVQRLGITEVAEQGY